MQKLQKIVSCFGFLALLSITACAGYPIPSGSTDINARVFKNPTDFEARVNSAEVGMTQAEVFKKLDISLEKTPNLEQISDQAIYNIIFAGAQIRGTPAEVDVFREEIRKRQYSGWSLPYEKTEGIGYLENWHYITKKESGFRLRVIIIFDDGRLYKKARVYGIRVIDSTGSESFVWKFVESVPGKVIKIVDPF